MHVKRGYKVLLFLWAAPFCLLSCSKKGDFINEGKVGSGVHYYPVILTDILRDTITHKYLNLTDTTFSPGQTLIFELDYLSQSPIASLELWAGKSPGDLKKVLDIPYRDSFLSPTRFVDTVLFHYQLPANIDSASVSEWHLQPRVVSSVGLESSMDAVVKVK